MHLTPRLLLSCLLLLPSCFTWAIPVHTQLDQAEQALERGTLPAAQKDTARQKLQQAREAIQSAVAVRERVSERRAGLAAFPDQERALQRSLAVDNDTDLRAWLARLPADADPDALERLLDQERRTIASLRDEQDRAAAELARLLSQPAQAGENLASLRQQIDALSAPQGVVSGESDVVAELRRLKRQADLELLRAQLDEGTLAQEAGRAEQSLLELRLRELRQRLARHEARLPVLQERITARARAALSARLEGLRAQQAELAGSLSIGAGVAQDNLALGEELLAASELLDRERADADASAQAATQLRAALRDTRTRLELGGGSAQVGQWLWQERIRLPAQARLRAQLNELRTTLAELRVRLIEVNEQQRALGDMDAALVSVLADVQRETDEPEPIAGDRDTARQLLRQRGDLLAQLDGLIRRRLATLEQREAALVGQRDDAQALQGVLDRNLLWTPSHAPVSVAWLSRVPEGLYDLVKPSRLATTADLVRRSFLQRPVDYLLSLVAVIMLLGLRQRAPVRLEALAAPTRQIRQDRFRHTLTALAVTLAAALPLPATLFLVGHLLQGVGTAGRFSDSLGIALTMTAWPALLFGWLRWLVIDKGVAHAHFRWTRSRRTAIAEGLRWIAPLALVSIFVLALAFTRNQALAIDVQARLAIVGLALLGAAWAWRALDVDRLWTPRGIDTTHSRPRRFARLLLPALCVMIVMLAVLGYVYSAAILVRALLSSIGVIVVVATIVATLARWFLVGERRLALYRREQKRQAQDDEQALLVEAEADITLETVSAHTRRILRAIRLSLLGIGLIWVWGDVLPAFARLDDITVWTFQETGSDGNRLDVPVSLFALLGGTLVLVLTTIAARNLPGLMELGLLSRSRIDAASRYAITSLFRYTIVIVGVLVGLSLFGLRWSQLQWMAAALTVGLGFGLQEIFANFVSGLILLFERPFRVGDTITVGGKTGTVTRIRTRATTLRDGEGREIFIPNKSFITGELTNWSLSDNPTTAIIDFGVAYGSDIPAVHAAALQAARENPRVLAEPAPVSAFKSFDGSVMTFELKVFLASLADRVPVRSELALHLTTLLQERDVQMSPAQDIHIRSLPAPADPVV